MSPFKRIRHFWSNLSISNKLYVVIGVMASLVASELFTLWFAMNAMSGVRSFVNGESLWSKAQKEAVISLHEYARTRQPQYLEKFFTHIDVIYGDTAARKAVLESDPVDRSVAQAGFLRGQNHIDDAESLIELLDRFRNISYIRNAVRVWTEADSKIDEIVILSQEVHRNVLANVPREGMVSVLDRIDALNSELTDIETQFSNFLGEGSRWLQELLMTTLILLVLCVESTGLLLTVSLSRSLSRRLREVNEGATKLSEGNLDFKVPESFGDEIGVLAQTLNKMAADLKTSENANRLKSLFLANMSHEMRTPLGAILGFAKLLQEPALSNEDRTQYIKIIEKTGESLTKIINDILDLSKVEAGHLEIEKKNFSLRALLNEVRMMCETSIGVKSVKVVVHAEDTLPDFIYTDPLRLQQILMNLLGNAIKFTESGEVRLTAAVKTSALTSELVFTLVDSGVGIAHNKQSLLFKTFSQVDSSFSRRHDGTGLGLVLSRHLARMLGGDVVLATSNLGEGSTFTIRIPFEIPTISPLVPEPEVRTFTVQERIQGKTILLVDDAEINRLLITRVLSKQGIIIEIAVNGLEAVEKASSRTYDAILMDIQMPIMDGRAATQKLRELGNFTPIIALTAHAMKEDRDRCLEAGCNDYLTKPVQFELLFSTLAHFMDLPRQEPKLRPGNLLSN